MSMVRPGLALSLAASHSASSVKGVLKMGRNWPGFLGDERNPHDRQGDRLGICVIHPRGAFLKFRDGAPNFRRQCLDVLIGLGMLASNEFGQHPRPSAQVEQRSVSFHGRKFFWTASSTSESLKRTDFPILKNGTILRRIQ